MRSLSSFAALPLLLSLLPAQAPPAAKPDARAEIARFVQRLDALLLQADVTNEHARATSGIARTVETQARDGGLEQAAKAVADAQQQLDQLANLITERTVALRALRSKIAAEAPAFVDPVGQLADKVATVVRMHSLTDAEAALVQIEKSLLEEPMAKLQGAGTLLGVTRYRLAETLRHRSSSVELRAKVGGEREAEKLLRRASAKLGEVLTCPDAADTGEGSSLHAAALRRIVQIEATLYDAYKRLSEAQPTARTYAQSAKKHRDAAEAAFEKLGRLHPTATLPDGTPFVAAARTDVERLAPR